MTVPRDGSPPPNSDVGRLVGGRYLLGDLLGIGGMATVHRALDTRFGRAVAVKLLRREVMEDVDIAMRFRREALAATVLRHPNIVACLEAGTDDGQPYLVMELVEGEDLAARLRRTGRLDPPEVARLGLDIARGLGVAHIRGIVHRDVKPGNILLARDGRAMVTDFGIARLAADAEGAVPGTTLGSVQYFSPEQARGATTTAASDVYGLGLVMYEALTGRRAWRGDTTAALAAVRIGAPAPSPRAVRPEVPPALEAVVVRALDADPALRYPNGGALAVALEPIVGRPDPASPTVVAGSPGASLPATSLAPAGIEGAVGDGMVAAGPSPSDAGGAPRNAGAAVIPAAAIAAGAVAVGGAAVAAGGAAVGAGGAGEAAVGAGVAAVAADRGAIAASDGMARASAGSAPAGVANGTSGTTAGQVPAGARGGPGSPSPRGEAIAGLAPVIGAPAFAAAPAAAVGQAGTGSMPSPAPSGAAPGRLRGPGSAIATPMLPPSGPSVAGVAALSQGQARPRLARRPSPAVAGPLLVLLSVLVVVGGAMYIAALPPGGDAGVLAAASASSSPSARPTSTPRATPRPTPTPKPTPKPTPRPTATPRPAPAAGTPDLCEPIFGLACGLDAGRYAPAKFAPAVRFDLRDGWAAAQQSVNLLVLSRREGTLTFASGIDTIYPSGDPAQAPGTARALVEAFITTDGVASGDPSDRKVDKRRARVVDLWPSGRGRLPLFGASEQVYFLEASGPTRVVVVDGPDAPLIITAEAADGSALQDLWPAAKRVIDSLHFR